MILHAFARGACGLADRHPERLRPETSLAAGQPAFFIFSSFAVKTVGSIYIWVFVAKTLYDLTGCLSE